MDHFKNPRNRGDLEGADVTRRGDNPRCGDEIEVGLYMAAGVLDKARFRGRGCSLCIASASLMTESISGLDSGRARRLAESVRGFFAAAGDGAGAPLPQGLSALAAAQAYPARHRCVLLAWEALAEALDAV